MGHVVCDIGHAVSSGVSAIGNGLSDVGHAVSNGVSGLGHAVSSVVHNPQALLGLAGAIVAPELSSFFLPMVGGSALGAGALAGAAIGGTEGIINGGNSDSLLKGALIGGVGGGLAGGASGALANTTGSPLAAGAITGAGQGAFNAAANGGNSDSILKGALAGGIGGGIGSEGGTINSFTGSPVATNALMGAARGAANGAIYGGNSNVIASGLLTGGLSGAGGSLGQSTGIPGLAQLGGQTGTYLGSLFSQDLMGSGANTPSYYPALRATASATVGAANQAPYQTIDPNASLDGLLLASYLTAPTAIPQGLQVKASAPPSTQQATHASDSQTAYSPYAIYPSGQAAPTTHMADGGIVTGIGGLAHGGLPSQYHPDAPEGHHPEFITGKTGFYAQGKGTGQSDDIPAMLHQGDFVMDADTVSAFGDGSSKAGANRLEQFRLSLPVREAQGGPALPAKIADGEYVLPAAFVTRIGGGDNARGAELLNKMREELRAHKRSAPDDKIPPKAKPPMEYLRMARG